MPIGTFGNMIDRIEAEIARTDINSEIRDAIRDSIAHYQRESFYFTENRTAAQFITVSGEEFYSTTATTVIPNLPSVDVLQITVSGNRYPLRKRTFQAIEAKSPQTTARGQPIEYAYYGGAIRLYPIPNGSYTCVAISDPRLVSLTTTTQTNVWMTEAEELIRSRAKWHIFTHVIRNYESAAAMRAAEEEAKAALDADSSRRAATGRVRPTEF